MALINASQKILAEINIQALVTKFISTTPECKSEFGVSKSTQGKNSLFLVQICKEV